MLLVNNTMINENIIICLCVRNCEKYLFDVKNNLDNIRSFVQKTKILFIESDSSDNTLSILESFSKEKDIKTISLGNLQNLFPQRTERIAYCRNTYLNIVEKSDFDYLLVLDGDSIGEEKITEESLSSNFLYENWDMMTANQPQGYYDLWALRHEEWMPFDCWDEFGKNKTKENFIKCITSRFKKIDPTNPPIKVNSAFGGAGLIRISSIKGNRHTGIQNGKIICEWVPFCEKLKNVFINPMFINSNKISEHISENVKLLG